MRLLLAPLLAVPLLALLPAGPAHAAATCQGLPATIEATSGTVTGTEGADVIVATGFVTVNALGGNDTICAGGGATVNAGAGDDSVVASGTSPSNDVTVDLGAGTNHYASSGLLLDSVTSGTPDAPDHDVIATGPGADSIVLTLAPGSDPQVDGGPTAEPFDEVTVRSLPADTSTWSLQTPSTVTRDGVPVGTFTHLSSTTLDLGPASTAVVRGTAGADRVTLGAGTVDVDLAGGKDILSLLPGLTVPTAGHLDFGPGHRDLLSADAAASIALDLRTAGGALQIDGSAQPGPSVSGVEASLLAAPKVAYQGGSGKDTVYAIGCRVALRGGPGNDVLSYANDEEQAGYPHCGEYRYRIFGQAGDDTMTGWTGRDVLDGGRGHDVADGKQGTDVCRAEVRRRCEHR